MLQASIRRPLTPSDHPPVLVLLHGLGADEGDLMGLTPELDPRLLIVSIRAPLEYGNGGYAWFEIRWTANGPEADSEQALSSLELLVATLEHLPDGLGVTPSQLLLGGFSQGAMMSVGVALLRPELVAGVVSMSGRLLPEFLPAELPATLAKVPFLVQHGTQDQVLPVAGSRQVRDELERAGCAVTYREYPMGHEINLRSLADVRQWIAGRL